MSESRLDIKINVPGKDSNANKVSGFKKIPKPQPRVSLDGLTKMIQTKQLTPEVEAKLIQMARKYPHGALPQFRKNLDKYIRDAMREVSKENSKKTPKEDSDKP